MLASISRIAVSAALFVATVSNTMAAGTSKPKKRHLRVSEDEDGSRNAQLSLDPMQICLYPTYDNSLDQNVLQTDMRRAMKTLVTTQLQATYPDRFGYFDFNDYQQFSWYSGEEDDPVCGDLRGVIPEAAGRQGIWGQSQSSPSDPMPCSCALYPGAVIFVMAGPDGMEAMNKTVMEPQIASILESGLVGALQDIAADTSTNYNGNDASARNTTLPAYFELQAAAVSFDVAMRVDGGDLVLPLEETDSPTRAPSRPPVELILTQAPTADPGTTLNTVSGLEAGNSLSSSSENNMEKYGMAIIIGVSVLFVLTCLCLCYIRLRRFGASAFCCCCVAGENDLVEEEDDDENTADHQAPRESWEKRAPADAPTVVGEEEEDEEEARRPSDAATAHSTGASELTNYQTGELLECVSVASEWTGDSNSQDKSSTAGYSSRMLVAAELMAAKETFDRDRNITLQKDMLHSEWSATPNTGAFDTAAALEASKDDNALSFEQAYEANQGEEVYLTPPRSARKSR